MVAGDLGDEAVASLPLEAGIEEATEDGEEDMRLINFERRDSSRLLCKVAVDKKFEDLRWAPLVRTIFYKMAWHNFTPQKKGGFLFLLSGHLETLSDRFWRQIAHVLLLVSFKI